MKRLSHEKLVYEKLDSKMLGRKRVLHVEAYL